MTVAIWVTVAGLALATAGIKAAGPVIFGGRPLRPLLGRVIPLLPAALLAALVVLETLGGPGRGLRLDARVVGVLAAAVVIALRKSLLVAVLVAAVATALTRALGWG
jgi:branched-subunit amino acid transport protein